MWLETIYKHRLYVLASNYSLELLHQKKTTITMYSLPSLRDPNWCLRFSVQYLENILNRWKLRSWYSERLCLQPTFILVLWQYILFSYIFVFFFSTQSSALTISALNCFLLMYAATGGLKRSGLVHWLFLSHNEARKLTNRPTSMLVAKLITM